MMDLIGSVQQSSEQRSLSREQACGFHTGSMLLLLITAFTAGCGGSSPPAPAPQTATPPPAATPAAPTGTAEQAAAPAAVAANEPGGKEKKWIGKIPYDVFFDQPLEIATDTTSIAAVSTPRMNTDSKPAAMESGASPAADTPSAAPAAAPSSGVAGGAVNWGDVIPMPMLVEEVKLLRTALTGNLQTVATFNKAQKPIALDGAMLAALSAVASLHPETVSWKPNAHFVRDLAFQINENSAGSGREPYMKTKDPFDKILVILDGGKPPEMESPETATLSEVVYVADMMKRIELSFNNLKANINTDAKLKENAADAEREVRILLTLATLMGDKSYDNTDQPPYQGFLKRFTDGARNGVQAIHTSSLSEFQAALNQIQSTCAECHQQYRGSESGF